MNIKEEEKKENIDNVEKPKISDINENKENQEINADKIEITKEELKKEETAQNSKNEEIKEESNKLKEILNQDILEGKINIIDKIIQKYMPASIDNKVIQIHQGLTSLSLKIDKDFNMLNDIGYRLPNLIELNLSGSELESIMDIGTSFNKLEKLNVSNCGLSDLNGIICFQNLKELNASKNKITDLIYIEMCEELKIIDLSYNLIEDENNLLFLNSCPKLQKVILTGNKIKKIGKNLLDKNIQLVI